MKRSTIVQIGFSLAFLTSNLGWARGGEAGPSTSAGIVEQQAQREYKLQDLSPNKEIPILDIDIPQEILNIPAGISVYIEHITVQQNFPLFAKEIEQATDAYLNKTLSSQDVLDLCRDVQMIYAKNGYILAWVYPPVQRIDNNTLVLSVVEGILSRIEIQGNVSYKSSYIQRYFESLLEGPVNYNSLMKALLLVNENTDLNIEGILRKASEFGGVDLVLNVQDKRPAHITVGYNNWGQASITLNQMTSTTVFGNLVTSGDKLTLMTTMGIPAVMYYVNPTYSIPLTGSGARLDLAFTYTHSNTQTSPEWELAGWSEIGTVTYSQPLARTRQFGADLFVSFEVNQAKNLSLGETTSFDKLRILSVGGKVDYVDSARGRNVFDAYVHAGIPGFLGGSDVYNPQTSRIGSGGRFFILNMDFQRVQPLLTDCMLVFTSSAQGTFNKIPNPEQFVLGGEGTVRGYQSAVAVGDVGYYANLEFYIPPPLLKNYMFKPMKKKWGDVLQLMAFVDHGGIYTVAPVDFELSPAYLTSVGAGARFYGPKNLSISFDAAFPVTHQYRDYNSIFYVMINMDLL